MSPSRFLFILLSLIPLSVAQAQSVLPAAPSTGHRVALVVGNNHYQHVDMLKSAVPDARSMQQALQGLGFQVIYRVDADRQQMLDAIDQFIELLSANTDALFYYSGHGVQIRGADFLVPVDLDAKTENQVVQDGIDLQHNVFDAIARTHARFTLAVIDASFDNPFERTLGAAKGMAPILPPPGGMVVFSAGANQLALDRLSDDDPDPDSLFTREFLIAMQKPHRSITEVIAEVRHEVARLAASVGHQQIPAVYDQAFGDFYFIPGSESNSPAAAPHARGIALVIGNAGYKNVPPLANSIRDAQLVAKTLTQLGFDLSGGGALTDLNYQGFIEALKSFGNRMQESDRAVGLFYYSGHGIQLNGVNYLVPVDANPTKPSDADTELVNANFVMRQMDDASVALKMVILDACRTNPFPSGRSLGSTDRGLAAMTVTEGTLIAYATQPGETADDGTPGGNGPYATALATSLGKPGLDVLPLFNDVGLQVAQATNRKQEPWMSSSPIQGSFYFAGR